MNINKKNLVLALGLGLSAALAAPVYADPPEWAGGKSEKHESKGEKHKSKEYKKEYKNDKHDKYERRESKTRYDDDHVRRDQHGNRIVDNDYFRDNHRLAVQDYYQREFRAGNCPPGLAKKNNGCLPPGHAKKWRVGQPLPSNIQYYPLPPEVVGYLGQPPAGYQYVRVDNDVLLLGTATRMVIDAIRNLGF